MEYPLRFDEPGAFEKYIAGLSLRTRRHQQSRFSSPDRRPLDERERRAYAIETRHIESQLRQMPQEERAKAEAVLKQAAEVMGERGLFDTWVSQMLIMGVTYKWFVVNALICLIAFVITGNYKVVYFLAPVIHVAGYLYLMPQLKREREKNIDTLLSMS